MTPYHSQHNVTIYCDDCVTAMQNMEDNSIDAIVTDPPYGLSKQPDIVEVLTHWLNGDDYEHTGGGFMGRAWDSFVPGPSVWRECLRVLKPGGHLLAFAGTRTVDLMGISLRLGGFEIRDTITNLYDTNRRFQALWETLDTEQRKLFHQVLDTDGLMGWGFGSGFPKSLDIGKAIDRAAIVKCQICKGMGWIPDDHNSIEREKIIAFLNDDYDINEIESLLEIKFACEVCKGKGKVKGAERDVIGVKVDSDGRDRATEPHGKIKYRRNKYGGDWSAAKDTKIITAPATPEAQQWEGFGTGLKPALENVIVGQKINPNLSIDALFDIIAVTNLQILCEVLLCEIRCQLNASNAKILLKSLYQKLKEVAGSIVLGNVLAYPKERELLEFANNVEEHLNLLRATLSEDMEFTVQENARVNGREDLPGKITLIGKVADLQEVMDILLSMMEVGNTDSNILSSWKTTLGEVLSQMSKFTILMKSEMITDLKTLNWLLFRNISESIIHQNETLISGQLSIVSIVEGHLKDLREKLNYILEHFAQDGVTLQNHPHYQVAIDNKQITPALEPVLLCRKPISEKNIAANVLRWGTGGINIDGCRVGYQSNDDVQTLSASNERFNKGNYSQGGEFNKSQNGVISYTHPKGRFPANLILSDDDEVRELFPETGKSNKTKQSDERYKAKVYNGSGYWGSHNPDNSFNDSGSAARFFYCAKSSKAERNAGLEGMSAKEKKTLNDYRNPSEGRTASKSGSPQQNHHPTVKPLALMRYLCRLITPPNGLILDPFAGSGSTLIAAREENFKAIGVELEEDYCQIAVGRLSQVQPNLFNTGD